MNNTARFNLRIYIVTPSVLGIMEILASKDTCIY